MQLSLRLCFPCNRSACVLDVLLSNHTEPQAQPPPKVYLSKDLLPGSSKVSVAEDLPRLYFRQPCQIDYPGANILFQWDSPGPFNWWDLFPAVVACVSTSTGQIYVAQSESCLTDMILIPRPLGQQTYPRFYYRYPKPRPALMSRWWPPFCCPGPRAMLPQLPPFYLTRSPFLRKRSFLLNLPPKKPIEEENWCTVTSSSIQLERYLFLIIVISLVWFNWIIVH